MTDPFQQPETTPMSAPVYTPTQPQIASPPPPTSMGERYLRTTIFVAAGLIVLIVFYALLPSVSAQEARAQYPRVHAAIGGIHDGTLVKENQAITFSATGSTGKDLSYHWDFGDGTTSNKATVKKTFTQPSQQLNVSLTVTDPIFGATGGSSHQSQVSLNIVVLPPPPTANFTWQAGFFTNEIDFDASSSHSDSQIQSYQWNFGDPASGSANTETDTFSSTTSHSYTNPGTYTVTLIVTDDYNQTATKTETVNVTSGT